MRRNMGGFTIVELLIVIVVIAILAAITIVAYNGIQTRANNTARIAGATQVIKAINAYKAAYDTYPTTASSIFCMTVDNVCSNYSGVAVTTSNTTLLNELAKVGNVPQSVPKQSGNFYGIYWNYNSSRTVAGDSAKKLLIMYWLEGNAVDCGMSGVVRDAGDGTYPLTTQKYTSTSSTVTTCWIGV